MPFSTLSRLVRRLFGAPTTRPITRSAFKPFLEALDPRVMPALFTWTDATGDNQYSDPYNWQNTAGVLSIPGPRDDILITNFGGASGGSTTGGGITAGGPSGGSADCYGMQSDPNGPFNSITISAGYTGTVTVTGPVQTLALYVNNGTIDQPTTSAGSDITVLGGATLNAYAPWVFPSWDGGSDFNWTGGTLNSTTSGATLHITGSSTLAVIDPLNAGSQSTGDTLSIEGGATTKFLPGQVIFTGGEGMNISEGSTVEDLPGPRAVTSKYAVDDDNGYLRIVDNGGLYKVTGPGYDKTSLPIVIPQGTLSITGNATAIFKNQTYYTIGSLSFPAGSVNNCGGSVIIESGSKLVPEKGMVQTSGVLVLKIATRGGISTLDGTLVVSGGTVQFNYDPAVTNGPGPGGKRPATFKVNGDVYWLGGNYVPTIDLSIAGDCSVWSVNGTMTISEAAQLTPNFVNFNQQLPNVSEWFIIVSTEPIDGMPAYDNNALTLDLNGKRLVLKK